MGLSAKQRRFVIEYLKGWNASGAAVAAGYSPRTARQQGSRLLSNANIQAEIQACLAEHVMTSDETLSILSDVARNMGSKYIRPTGRVDLPALLADGFGHVVKGVKETKYGMVIEFYDAQAALALIARHYKLLDQAPVEANIRIEGLESLLDRIYGKSSSTINLSHELPAIPARGGE